MQDIIQTAESIQQKAWQVIRDTQVMEIWSSIGARIHLVGSLGMGLLINKRDIDFHIYTSPFRLSDSFAAISRLAANKDITTINYANLLETEEQCIEWHAFYQDQEGQPWQLDMIHILDESPYAGHFEKVAQGVCKVLTPEMRADILRIKSSIPPGERVMAIQIYKAVIEAGVRDLESFRQWQEHHPDENLLDWIP
ncbi:hypothetical protein [Desulfogranum mediterraneum]|uniref:hypothetical protein n=1 Tax=Desulfogranum mediterraneum TaxID=160661 RepID=UPI00041304D0|nr:hypothetical protein [Desulfogranum mediterraneum]